ncbi:MAG: ribose 5-phosphate isomerase B [Clostridia bacterium]|nr:ribose 5-phosphate isomerase B [Clostridia bacterium]
MRIALGADHAGYELKRLLRGFIADMGHEVTDMGCYDAQRVDYPDIGIALGSAVANGECDLGVLVCGTGIGMSIAANKVRGVRCALCGDAVSARFAREHNDANILALGARIIGDETAKAIVAAWLGAEFGGGRHAHRLDIIAQYENTEAAK